MLNDTVGHRFLIRLHGALIRWIRYGKIGDSQAAGRNAGPVRALSAVTDMPTQRLAMTLISRHSTLSVRTAFPRTSKQDVLSQETNSSLKSAGALLGKSTLGPCHTIRLEQTPSHSGVFTGQGHSGISSSTAVGRSSELFSIVFAVVISLPGLYQASTLELLAARLAGNSNLVHIDWEKEMELDNMTFGSPRSANGQKTPTRSTEGISVPLKGPTGFLGTAILRQLVHLAHIAHDHCAAIRVNAQGEPR
ncbi:uncharacterized protein BP5553_04025 [Venustampulla echinocandica]|uniref:Uncharacterized protein n=1 Tax=Venustampulla echinocandica TaxID=2656787 RepID=A0A370TVY3_9HELO|nr:uncharacterized protein BP5553_04025 [Venustampulla echinocandica]RDL39685.1 hypothetical protein BP5553_04025 [Venustampulla echinocandica]